MATTLFNNAELPEFLGDPRDGGLGGGGGGGDGLGGGGGGDIGSGGTGGGGTGGTGTPDEKQLTEMQFDEGGNLVVAYGQHLVAGHLIQYDYSAGPPPVTKFIAALGEGPWDSVVKAYYAGEEITASPDGTTAGYHFHPGTISTGIADPVQGEDSFFTSPPTYSRTAYAAVLLTADQSVEERPDKFRAICHCLKVANYNTSGVETDAGSYSANPARVAADVMKRAGLLSLIHWPTWVTWRDYCDATISWGARTIPRFECHLALTQPVDIPTALSFITQTACTFWQFDGVNIRFLATFDATLVQPGNQVYTFTEANCRNVIVGAGDRRGLPTGYIARFRDLDDDYMSEVTVEVYSEELETLVGAANRIEIQLPPMYRSQAERICYWRLQLDGWSNIEVELTAFGGSSKVLAGDLIAVEHEVLDFTNDSTTRYLICTETEDLPEESGPSLRRIRGKIIYGSQLYWDGAHTAPPA